MAVELLTPMSQVTRRSAPIGGSDILTGRLVAINSSGQVVAPGTQRVGLYLALEGNKIHVGGNAASDFGATTPFASTNSKTLPSVAPTGAIALAYGVYRYKVGPEGVDPAATYTVGQLVRSDADGRLVAVGAEATGVDVQDVASAVVEGVSTVNSRVSELVVRTLGN